MGITHNQFWIFAALMLLPSAKVRAEQKPARQEEVKIQKTSLTRDQEIQLGKESAAQVEKEMEVVQNAPVEAWLNKIGQSLAKTPQANAYPYYFKLVNDDSINAFALPGGPMFVHTGLIKAADSEGEVAGVLAHEMSHVALRHGAAQISKQQTWGTFFGVLQQAAGLLGGTDGTCGMLCQATKIGAGLGGNSLLMKFSRGYEHDADLNGARMMNAAGYNPIELPKFFEKLESKLGTAAEPKGLALWMSSHPATGSRIQYVSRDIEFYPKTTYTAATGSFPQMKQLVSTIPPAKLKPAALLSTIQQTPRQGLPSGFNDYSAKGFAIAFPGDWQAGQAQAAGSVYLIPQGGAVKNQNGVELLTGAMLDYYVPAKGPGSFSLESGTNDFIDSLKKSDSNLRAAASSRTTLGNTPALLTQIRTKTSNGQDQSIHLYTAARQAGIWYLVQATAPQQSSSLEPIFQQMVQTVTFRPDVP